MSGGKILNHEYRFSVFLLLGFHRKIIIFFAYFVSSFTSSLMVDIGIGIGFQVISIDCSWSVSNTEIQIIKKNCSYPSWDRNSQIPKKTSTFRFAGIGMDQFGMLIIIIIKIF